jgi:hypothetical protein
MQEMKRIRISDESQALVIDGRALTCLEANRVQRLPIAPRRAIAKKIESCGTHDVVCPMEGSAW